MKCFKCGSYTSDGSTFCQVCGVNLKEAEASGMSSQSSVNADPRSTYASNEPLVNEPETAAKRLAEVDLMVYEWSKKSVAQKIQRVISIVMAIAFLFSLVLSVLAAFYPEEFVDLFGGFTFTDAMIYVPLLGVATVIATVAVRWSAALLSFLSMIGFSKWLKEKDDEIDYYGSIRKRVKKHGNKKNDEAFGNALVIKENVGATAPHIVLIVVKTVCQLLLLLFAHDFFVAAFASWMRLVMGDLGSAISIMLLSPSGIIFVGALVVQMITAIVCGSIIRSARKKLYKRACDGEMSM